MNESMQNKSLSIIDKYEGALNYLYPILLNVSHKHRVLRDETLRVMLAQRNPSNGCADNQTN
jgi:hypothetical protein